MTPFLRTSSKWALPHGIVNHWVDPSCLRIQTWTTRIKIPSSWRVFRRSNYKIGVKKSPHTRDHLTCGEVSTHSGKESNHRGATIPTFCFVSHFLFSRVVFIMMMRSPSWVNCSTSSGCHSSSSYKSFSFRMSSQRAFSLDIEYQKIPKNSLPVIA